MRWLLLFALFLQPTPPPVLLSATFVTSTSAVVSWEQPAEMASGITCLRIYHAGAEWPAGICWNDLEAGPRAVHLPGIYDKKWYTPAVGDRLILAFGMDDVGSAVLGEAIVYRTYLPLVGKRTAPLNVVRLPVFLR